MDCAPMRGQRRMGAFAKASFMALWGLLAHASCKAPIAAPAEIGTAPTVRLTGSAPPPESPLSIWYRQPAANLRLDQFSDALPIGNGRMGAMVQGGVATESLQFNEESLWSGGPGGRERDSSNSGAAADYNFGYNPTATDRDAIYAALKDGGTGSPAPEIRRMLQGNYNGYGKYKNFGQLNLDYMFPPCETEVKGYRRELDLSSGAARVSYQVGDTAYSREYVASFPDNAIAIRIAADRPGKVNLRISLDPGQTDGKVGAAMQMPTAAASGNRITMSGGLMDNGLLYAAAIMVDATNGAVAADPGSAELVVSNADSAAIYLSAATDYRNEYQLPPTGDFMRLSYRTGETLDQLIWRAESRLAASMGGGYAAFRARHQEDYQSLFNRVELDLGGANEIPTDRALAEYRAAENTVGPQHQMLEALLYQYGRYLLIASSREGSLPANLQGVWNTVNDPPWSADYHTNINLQMNYWPAAAGNLLEALEPLQKYVESLTVTGRYTAQKYGYPASVPDGAWKEPGSGWATHVSGGIYGLTAPGTAWSWGWSPAANAFLSQNLYQYIQYGGDKTVFKNDYWPIIRGAAVMWLNSLYMPADGLWAGKYVALPSYSPEHGPLTVATAYDQQLIQELFAISLDCLKKLGLEDAEAGLKADIEEKLEGLWPGMAIGSFGQIQEWAESPDDSAPGSQGIGRHRHMSQLVGFYPGTSIANGGPAGIAAAKKTLELRGLGATGWSMGWKINLWARAREGNIAYRLINNLLKENIAPNLLGQHLPQGFQIDGNFGYAAGVHEMLLQGHSGCLDLLPALPDAWVSGSMKGIRSMGGHTLNIAWADGALASAEIEAHTDCVLKVRSPAFYGSTVTVNGEPATAEGGAIDIAAEKGSKHLIRVLKL